MKLITYWHSDDAEFRTLMVDELRDRYNTPKGYMLRYAVGDHRVEIREDDVASEVWLDPRWHVTPQGMRRKL